jgi:large subunit ribosomal protein L10
MSNNLERKKAIVEEIKAKFESSQSAVVVNYRGLTVEEVTELRNKFREANVEYKVYKNNLVKIAIKDTDFEGLSADLAGPNAIAFGIEDAVAPAKIVKDFAKDHENLELKSGVVEKVYYDNAKIMEIANLPSKEELIGRFMGSIKAPVSNFAYFLSNLMEKKEEEGAEA